MRSVRSGRSTPGERRAVLIVAGLLVLALLPTSGSSHAHRVGSKVFTESVILGEMLAQLGRDGGAEMIHEPELGGTRLVFEALVAGEIDAYVEYTGTLMKETFALEAPADEAALAQLLAEQGIRMGNPLGFNNTYVLAMQPDVAEAHGIETITDLARHPELTLGFGHEFLDRDDGWPALQVHYGLAHREIVGMDHDLAYTALANGDIDVIDSYRTDARIEELGLRLLRDDRDFFPRYDAVVLMRSTLPDDLQAEFARLEGRIDDAEMTRMNRRAEIDGVVESLVAAEFLQDELGVVTEVEVQTLPERFGERTLEHVNLVRMSLLPAILIAVPFGIFAAKRPRLGQGILVATGLIQTIPSLALLVILIPVVGAVGLSSVGSDSATAVIALFLYSLLPIVRNTYTGIHGIAPQYREAAIAIGLSPRARLFQVELPMALPTVLAGIKTAAVMNVGFATLGALIGAGGYGRPILTGIRRADTPLILLGAAASAGLALLVHAIMELLERWMVSPGLRR